MKEIDLYTNRDGAWVARVRFTVGEIKPYEAGEQFSIETQPYPSIGGEGGDMFARASALHEANAVITAWERFGYNIFHDDFNEFFNVYLSTRPGGGEFRYVHLQKETWSSEAFREWLHGALVNASNHRDSMGAMIIRMLLTADADVLFGVAANIQRKFER